MTQEDGYTTSFLAAADYSANQYYAVMISTTDKTVTIATATTDNAVILVNDPGSGEAAHVCMFGRCKAKIGGTVTAADLLGPDADAMLNVRSSDGDKFCAVALENGVDGDIIEVFVLPYSQLAA